MGVVEQVDRIDSIMQEGEVAGKPTAACVGSVCTIKPYMVVLVYNNHQTQYAQWSVERIQKEKGLIAGSLGCCSVAMIVIRM